ncbi:MAG: hypothetical protein HZB23_09945 [Deltaproteobacteria bacterium]|nr:hypothetical protein [Deltaproteobacteria bacterium]
MKRIILALLAVSLFALAFCLPAWAEKVEKVTGSASIVDGNTASARQKALEQALRSAVEQGIGVFIDSQTQAANFTVIRDSIYSKASGYVKTYQVTGEGPAADGQTYEITIKAEVETASIANDLNAIGIQLKFAGNPRFMAVYLPETENPLSRSAPAVTAAEKAITDVFLQKGCVILDPRFTAEVYKRIERAGQIAADVDDLAKMALEYQADLLLVYDVKTAKAKTDSSYFAGLDTVFSIRIVSPSTGDILAQKGGRNFSPMLVNQGEHYENEEAAKAAAKTASGAANELLGQVLDYWQRQVHQGARLDVWFKNFSEEDLFVLADILENLDGVKDTLVRNQSPGNFKVDVMYQGKPFDFQRDLFRVSRQKGVAVETHQAEGNRFMFFKKGTKDPYR